MPKPQVQHAEFLAAHPRATLMQTLADLAARMAPAYSGRPSLPEHVRLANEIIDAPDDADLEPLLLRFLFAILAAEG